MGAQGVDPPSFSERVGLGFCNREGQGFCFDTLIGKIQDIEPSYQRDTSEDATVVEESRQDEHRDLNDGQVGE